MEMTGILRSVEVRGSAALAERKVSTSVWDWSVMSTDSAEVMQPLGVLHVR